MIKYFVIALLLSGCTAIPLQYNINKETMAEQQMKRLDNMERGLINEAKQYQK